MKKIGLIIFIAVLTSSAFGQQFLWSTVKNDTASVKYVPINRVTNEVLSFYDHYDLYYDFAGFSKERFIDEMDYGFDDWEWLNDINDLTVFALRSNTGEGSVVLIMCISKNNINMIIFSNNVEGSFQLTLASDKDKFAKWFKTLLN